MTVALILYKVRHWKLRGRHQCILSRESHLVMYPDATKTALLFYCLM